MATSTCLLFGFPVRAKYPFTTVVDGSVHHGMVQQWYHVIAAVDGDDACRDPAELFWAARRCRLSCPAQDVTGETRDGATG